MIRDDYVEIRLTKGYAMMQIRESAVVCVYEIQLSNDRSKATISRKVFEYADWGKDEIGKCVQHNEDEMTLEEIKHNQKYGEVFVWLVRGMWGIPLSFVGKET